jgi:hypothetical protein
LILRTKDPDPRGYLLAETARTWEPQPSRLRASSL